MSKSWVPKGSQNIGDQKEKSTSIHSNHEEYGDAATDIELKDIDDDVKESPLKVVKPGQVEKEVVKETELDEEIVALRSTEEAITDLEKVK